MLGEATLLAWCAAHRITVEVRRGRQSDCVYNHKKRHIVVSSWDRRSRLHMFIHEIGHAVLRNRTSYYLRSSPYVAQPRTTSARLAVIHEEFDAWSEGKALAEKLGLQIDERSFDRSRAQCLRSYMEQYLYPHRYE